MSDIFLHSKGVVTQEGPMSMIAYDIGILPLIKKLKRELPDVTQPGYADGAGELGMFTRIETCFNLLTRQGPRCGYHRKPSKRVLIVHPNHPEAGKWFGARHGFKVCTGARYLRGYIRDNDSKRDWLRERTLKWDKNIGTIRKTAGKYPHECYTVVVQAIQS